MENETIWKVGLVVLVLLVVVGVYNNNNKFTEEVTGEVIGDSITGQVIGNTNEVGLFKRVGIGIVNPINTLDISSEKAVIQLNSGSEYNPSIVFMNDNNMDNRWSIGKRYNNDNFFISRYSSSTWSTPFEITPLGKINMGTPSNSVNLDVKGRVDSMSLFTDHIAVDGHILAKNVQTAKLTIQNLNGTGKAYACLSEIGYLYRSSRPCV